MKNDNTGDFKQMSFRKFLFYVVLLIGSLQISSRLIAPLGKIDCTKFNEFQMTPELKDAIKAPFYTNPLDGLNSFKGVFALQFISAVAPSYLLFYLCPWIELVGCAYLSYKYVKSSSNNTNQNSDL